MTMAEKIVSAENQIKIIIFDSDVPKEFVKYIIKPSEENRNEIYCKVIYLKGKKEVIVFENTRTYLTNIDVEDITKKLTAVHIASQLNKYIDFKSYRHEWDTNLYPEDSYISFNLKKNKNIKIIPGLNLIVAKRNFTLTIFGEEIEKTACHKVEFSLTDIDEKISEIEKLLSEPLSNFIEIKDGN